MYFPLHKIPPDSYSTDSFWRNLSEHYLFGMILNTVFTGEASTYEKKIDQYTTLLYK